ncbi:hypothetical protein GQ457_08G018490 [Hibiscus cannabinus]
MKSLNQKEQQRIKKRKAEMRNGKNFLKANSVSLGCLRSVIVGLPGYNNVGSSTVAPVKRSGTNLIFNYHRKNNADLRESKERKTCFEMRLKVKIPSLFIGEVG